jgi:hypothetical protein
VAERHSSGRALGPPGLSHADKLRISMRRWLSPAARVLFSFASRCAPSISGRPLAGVMQVYDHLRRGPALPVMAVVHGVAGTLPHGEPVPISHPRRIPPVTAT